MNTETIFELDRMLAGAVVRMGQACISLSTTVLIGFLVAAIFERILGREGTRRLFGGNQLTQIFRAWILGMLLPVCSLGVLPILVQMRRSGISGGTIVAFALTAPLFNPVSILYGLTLSDPKAIFAFTLCSLIVVTLLGLLWDKFCPNTEAAVEPVSQTPYGAKRIAAVVVSMAYQSSGHVILFILVALLGVGVVSSILPAGCLQHSAARGDWTAPLLMAGVAGFACVSPLEAMTQVASMFQHGNSIAAAFTLLVLGAGANLGTLVWSTKQYGLRRTCVWFGSLLLIVLSLSYAMDGPLQQKGVQVADHTHAFDSYTNPFPSGSENLWEQSKRILRESMEFEELISLILVGLFVSVGLILRCFDRKKLLLSFLASKPAKQPRSNAWFNDFELSNRAIVIASLVGLFIAGVLSCYLFYPPVSDLKREMNSVQAELLGAVADANWDAIESLLETQESLSQKLKVSAYLRLRPLNRYEDLKLHVYQNKLELLDHAADRKDLTEAKRFNRDASVALRRFKDATAGMR